MKNTQWLAGVMAFLWLLPLVAIGDEKPLSAIDWLSQSVRDSQIGGAETGISDGADDTFGTGGPPEEITVTPLGQIHKDTVGLLPSSVTGLPRNFWGSSSSQTIQSLITGQKTDPLPEILTLLYKILLAEIESPSSSVGGSELLLVRTDKLLELGALDQAEALLERAGPTEVEIFRRWFDVSLLTGQEDHACNAMAAAPGFAPTLQARVFCLARNGDWNAAALTLATGESLGFISQSEADLMTRFLDPDIFEGQGDLPLPERMTPLVFTMREAIAEPRPPGILPLAFQFADLRPETAWRTKLEAAERLVRTQALDMKSLVEFYIEKRPAASGGIWSRVAAIQAFDIALLSGDHGSVSDTLPAAFSAMEEVHLEVAFSRFYGDRLAAFKTEDNARQVAFKTALLSPGYEAAGSFFKAATEEEKFLLNISKGIGQVRADVNSTLENAIADAFSKPFPEGQLFDLLSEDELGEAVLRAMMAFDEEGLGDPGDIRAALATLRAVGLEEEARRTALQLLILDRRG